MNGKVGGEGCLFVNHVYIGELHFKHNIKELIPCNAITHCATCS